MDNRIILQVPMSQSLKEKAESVATDYGFSSLQEVVRVMLNKFARKAITLTFQETEEITSLSPANEKYYKKSVRDIKKGVNIFKPKDTDEFFKMLNS